MGLKLPYVREEFEDTAYWNPEIQPTPRVAPRSA